MRRDGSQSSVWQPCINDFAPSANESGYEVKISGNGVIALATALSLQQQGKNCVLVTDRETQLPATAYLTTILPNGYQNKTNAALIADGMRAAIDLAEEWIISSEMECDLVYEPGYLFSAQADNDIQTEKFAAEEAGLVTTMVKSIPVPISFAKACRFEYQARLNPSAFCSGLAKAFMEAGGTIVDCNVVNYKDIPAEDSVVLDTEQTNRNSYHLAFTLASGIYPYGVAQCGDNEFYSFQLAVKDGKEYVLASLLDVPQETDAVSAFEKLEQVIRASFNIASLDFHWINKYYYNGDPLIGTFGIHNNDIRYLHASAGSSGFTTALLAAQVIADTVLGKENPFAALVAGKINHLTTSEA
ncbi:NAD(P)/FAD-dependent oxidoreductase [Taibaiella soli]|uniref:FAD dependent oxidoreductase domain-containing protein n=1 Tax=Taibaiella soli TaxID=1649169 RepID=A0A2W2AN78_9BACT|nr:FAD-dependent oxidoreductase [Taibaiella soli]PZF73780.1 hypothetical protein DN068_05415 [Taibaiella soli]